MHVLMEEDSFIIKSFRLEKTSTITSKMVNSAQSHIPNNIHMPFCLLFLLLLLSVLLLLKYFCQCDALCVPRAVLTCLQGEVLPHSDGAHTDTAQNILPWWLGHLRCPQPGPGVQEQQMPVWFPPERLSCCEDKLETVWESKSIPTQCWVSLIASLSAFNCNELSGSAQWGAETLGWNLCNSPKCLHKSQVNVKLPTDSGAHETLFVFSLGDRGSKAAHMAVHWSREMCLSVHRHAQVSCGT